MGSIETVAVLFTDLVGSTALSSQLGPVAADELRREHFALLRQAIDEVGGREVKNLGDGLMVVFGSASTAVRGAVAMQQRSIAAIAAPRSSSGCASASVSVRRTARTATTSGGR